MLTQSLPIKYNISVQVWLFLIGFCENIMCNIHSGKLMTEGRYVLQSHLACCQSLSVNM